MPRPRKSTYGSEKPPYSYVALCAMAIQHSTTGMLTLSDIYRFITNSFPFYKTSSSKWRNSLRHNLSFNDCFVKIVCTTSSGSKKCYWSLHPNCGNMFKDGTLLRRKRRFTATGQKRGSIDVKRAWETNLERKSIDLNERLEEYESSCITQSKDSSVSSKETILRKKKTDFTIDSILNKNTSTKDNSANTTATTNTTSDEHAHALSNHVDRFRFIKSCSRDYNACHANELYAEFLQPHHVRIKQPVAADNYIAANDYHCDINKTYHDIDASRHRSCQAAQNQHYSTCCYGNCPTHVY
eukprot:gene9000-9961_t